MPKMKPGFFDFFRLTDRDSCETAIRNGAILAAVGAALGTIFGAIGLANGPSGDKALDYILDPWILGDAILLAGLAAWLYLKKSRVAATILVIYFIVSKITMMVELGRPGNLFVSAFFFMFYVTAMRATFRRHDINREFVSAQRAQSPGVPIGPPSKATNVREPPRIVEVPIARSPSDLCPSCYEFREPGVQTCRYCGARFTETARRNVSVGNELSGL